MNRINQLFATPNHSLLSIYFCAGHPVEVPTTEIIKTLAHNGVSMIEIGIPFSDPMADGPVIQDAATQALCGGMTLRKLFADLSEIRHEVSIPLLLMGYLNPIMRFGFSEFCAECARVGIDGVIIPDLPFRDYQHEFRPIAEQHNVRLIMLITPETSDERIRLIDENTDGFIYMVSSASTTGAKDTYDAATQSYFARIAAMPLHNPRMIGFGISNKATFNAACAHARGGIVGSRFVSLIDTLKDPDKAIKELKHALKSQ